MTAHDTVPATSPRQADDRYLAACSALLVAMATNSTINDQEAEALLGAMPDAAMRDGLRFALGCCGVTDGAWGLGR